MGKINVPIVWALNHSRTFQFVTLVVSQGIGFPFPLHRDQEEGVAVPKRARTHRGVTHGSDTSVNGQNTIKRHTGQNSALLWPVLWSMKPWALFSLNSKRGIPTGTGLVGAPDCHPLLQTQQGSGTEDTVIYRFLYFQCHTDRLCFTVLIPKINEKLWGSEREGNIKVKLKFSRQSVVWLNLREALQSGSFPVSWLPIWHKELSKQVFSKGTHMDHDANSTNWPNFPEIPRHLNKKKPF